MSDIIQKFIKTVGATSVEHDLVISQPHTVDVNGDKYYWLNVIPEFLSEDGGRPANHENLMKLTANPLAVFGYGSSREEALNMAEAKIGRLKISEGGDADYIAHLAIFMNFPDHPILGMELIEEEPAPAPELDVKDSMAGFFQMDDDKLYFSNTKLVVGSCRYGAGIWAALLVHDNPGEVADAISEEPHWEQVFEHPLFPGVFGDNAKQALEKLEKKCEGIKSSHELTVTLWGVCNLLLKHDQYNGKADEGLEMLKTYQAALDARPKFLKVNNK